jgi:carbonic anhydrase/acetyltransferase-like protein (isoleucine patch superfamily)
MIDNQQMCIRPNPRGDWPEVHPTAYVDPTAQVIGRVQVGPDVFIGPNAVIRADECDTGDEVRAIILEAECNVQDGVIIHALAGAEVTIGQRTSLTHGVIVHGPCRIGEGCFIGFGAVVFASQLGRGVFAASRAVIENVNVPADTFIPAFTFISQDRINRLRKTEPKERNFMADVVRAHLELAEGYLGLMQTGGDSNGCKV